MIAFTPSINPLSPSYAFSPSPLIKKYQLKVGTSRSDRTGFAVVGVPRGASSRGPRGIQNSRLSSSASAASSLPKSMGRWWWTPATILGRMDGIHKYVDRAGRGRRRVHFHHHRKPKLSRNRNRELRGLVFSAPTGQNSENPGIENNNSG